MFVDVVVVVASTVVELSLAEINFNISERKIAASGISSASPWKISIKSTLEKMAKGPVKLSEFAVLSGGIESSSLVLL